MISIQESTTMIEVVNIHGIAGLYQIPAKWNGSNTYKETIYVKDWEPGIYIIRVKNSDQTIAIKSVVVN